MHVHGPVRWCFIGQLHACSAILYPCTIQSTAYARKRVIKCAHMLCLHKCVSCIRSMSVSCPAVQFIVTTVVVYALFSMNVAAVPDALWAKIFRFLFDGHDHQGVMNMVLAVPNVYDAFGSVQAHLISTVLPMYLLTPGSFASQVVSPLVRYMYTKYCSNR